MNNRKKKQPLVLVVLDGWGVAKSSKGNAISCASPLFFNELTAKYPTSVLNASEEKVGLPHGVFGNSEVGHLNLGAGRVVFQDILRINKAIKDQSFFNNKELRAVTAHLKKTKGVLHIMGLVSDGRVHSSLEHLFSLLSFAKKYGLKEVYIHAFLDGRDTPRNSGRRFISGLEKEIIKLGLGKIATVSGRFYAMDRDNHWERINKAYNAMVYGQGEVFNSADEAISASYQQEVYDEEMLPVVIKNTKTIKNGDAIIFFNYRADRAREITKAFVDKKLKIEKFKKFKDLYFLSFTEYEKNLGLNVAFPSERPINCLGEVISHAGLKQLRIAETEKYAHVTYFFNGGNELSFSGENRALIPSPRVDNYATYPQMSARLICSQLLIELKNDIYDFILVNFANADMLGHTGNIPAAVSGIKTVDACLKKIVKEVLKIDGTVIVTADHGNADYMLDDNDNVVTAHSLNPVPLVHISNHSVQLKSGGKLADIAPTLLELMNIEIPKEMTGISLIQK